MRYMDLFYNYFISVLLIGTGIILRVSTISYFVVFLHIFVAYVENKKSKTVKTFDIKMFNLLPIFYVCPLQNSSRNV